MESIKLTWLAAYVAGFMPRFVTVNVDNFIAFYNVANFTSPQILPALISPDVYPRASPTSLSTGPFIGLSNKDQRMDEAPPRRTSAAVFTDRYIAVTRDKQHWSAWENKTKEDTISRQKLVVRPMLAQW